MPARILISRRWPSAVEAELCRRYEVTLNADDLPLDADAFRAAMFDYDAICPTVSDRLTADILSVASPRVRIVGNYGAGFEHIDLAAARDNGIVVTNTPDVLTDATADLAILLLLMASRRAWEGALELREGRWTGWRPTHLVGQSLTGKTLALVGYGRIARATADRARAAFGMKIVYHARSDHKDADATYYASLDDMMAVADVVSLHCPGGPETHHLVDARLLRRMKPTAILVNTARGSVVNEADLAAALKAGTIAAVGLDVYAREPTVNPDLLALPNAVLLPHLGSATLETREAMGWRVLDNLDRFFAGEAPHDRVA